MTYGSSNPALMSAGAGMGHSGFDHNAASLTGKRHLSRISTVETSGTPGRRRRVVLKSKGENRGSLGGSSSNHEEAIYDKHLLANMGPQRLVGLSMNLGKAKRVSDASQRFLSNLNQHGRVQTSWNGSLLSDIDQRTVIVQYYRHRYSDDSTSTSSSGNILQAAYPVYMTSAPYSNLMPTILVPNNWNTNGTANTGVTMQQKTIVTNPGSLLTFWNNASTMQAPAQGDVIYNAYYNHLGGTSCFANVNRPDLEDMSWNLNKLKLERMYLDASQGDSSQVKFSDNVGVYHSGRHRRQSILQQNNFHDVKVTALSGTPTTGATTAADRSAPYVYDVVLRHGTIAYEFQNKNDTGCTVEVIVYKVKKTANLSAVSDDYKMSSPQIINNPQAASQTSFKCSYPLNMLIQTVGAGYLNTLGDAYSTENQLGRAPQIRDIYDNPNYPLIPKLKKTKESMNPFTEVMRNKFILTAGSRRALTIKLPGEIYNPCSIPIKKSVDGHSLPVYDAQSQNGFQLSSAAIPCLDEYTYGVILAVNGQKMTRFFDSAGKARSGSHDQLTTWKFQRGTYTGGTPVDMVQNTQYFLDKADFPYTGMYNICIPAHQGVSNNANTPAVWRFFVTAGGKPPSTSLPDYTSSTVFDSQTSSWPALVDAGADFEINNATGQYEVFIQSDQGPGPGIAFNTCVDTETSTSIVMVKVLSTSGYTPTAARPPTELPMGDNHGSAHVDYSCTYTEHIGACAYKTPKERNLWSNGYPVPPVMQASTDGLGGVPSTTSSRIIMPATSVVRQAERTTIGVNAQGNATGIQQTENSAGSGIGPRASMDVE